MTPMREDWDEEDDTGLGWPWCVGCGVPEPYGLCWKCERDAKAMPEVASEPKSCTVQEAKVEEDHE